MHRDASTLDNSVSELSELGGGHFVSRFNLTHVLI